jgi:hypothetical protein
MRRVLSLWMVCGLIACSLSALAQGGGRGQGRMGMMGGGMMMLSIPEVQQELKMTPDQISKLQSKSQEVRQATMELMREAGGPQAFQEMSQEERQQLMEKMQAIQKKAISELLNADQQKRYHQLELQQQGVMAFGRKEVREALKLTADQGEKIQEIQRSQMQAMREAMQGVDFQNMTDEERQAMQRRMEALQKATYDKCVAVLTAEQQKQWKEMIGEPFKFPTRRPMRRPGG